jgi:hypothetical protein
MAKNNTNGAPAGKRASTHSAAVIAGHISAILNHPGTPHNIYNALADAMGELYIPQGYYNSVEHISALLVANIKKGGETDA